MGSLLKTWLGANSTLGSLLQRVGLNYVTNATLASVIGWIIVLLAIWILGALVKSAARYRFESFVHETLNQIPLVSSIYGPVSKVVGMLKRDEESEMQSMSVVYCEFGADNGGGFLALLSSEKIYQFLDDISLADLIQRPRVLEVAKRQSGKRESSMNEMLATQKVSRDNAVDVDHFPADRHHHPAQPVEAVGAHPAETPPATDFIVGPPVTGIRCLESPLRPCITYFSEVSAVDPVRQRPMSLVPVQVIGHTESNIGLSAGRDHRLDLSGVGDVGCMRNAGAPLALDDGAGRLGRFGIGRKRTTCLPARPRDRRIDARLPATGVYSRWRGMGVGVHSNRRTIGNANAGTGKNATHVCPSSCQTTPISSTTPQAPVGNANPVIKELGLVVKRN